MTGLLPLLLCLAAVVSLQWASGAFSAEFSSPDEPAHYVTGLMIRDYLTSGFSSTPMSFATNYYIHYPKVAFGIWPPFFHVVEAAWMLVFSASRVSLLALTALLTAMTAFFLGRVAGREWGASTGIVMAAAFIVLPVTQYVSNRVIADGLVALLDLLAVLAWARYLDDGLLRQAVAFGLLGSLSMLTKGNGSALVAIPVISALLSGRLSLMRRRTFWLGPGMMLILAGPYQLYSWAIVRSTQVVGRGLTDSLVGRLVTYLSMIKGELGWLAVALAVIGFGIVVRRMVRGQPVEGLSVAMAAAPIAIVGFHSLVPLAPSSRYMVAAMPCLLWLAAIGVSAVCDVGGRSRARPIAVVLGGAVLASIVVAGLVHMPHKHHYGLEDMAKLLIAVPDSGNAVIMSSSTGEGDGMIISEIAMREKRPGRIILRADKVLSRSTWDGGRYQLTLHDAEAVNKYLASVPVDFVVIDNLSPGEIRPDHRLLMDTVIRFGSDWSLVTVYPEGAPLDVSIRVYRAARALKPGKRNVAIDMTYTLGRTITLK